MIKLKNGNVQIVKIMTTMNNFKKILKGSLLHFIYIPITIIGMMIIGEDFNTTNFAILLALLLSIILFTYNISVLAIFSKVFNHSNFIFNLTPFIIFIIFFSKLNEVMQGLDFGGEYNSYIVLVLTFIINLVTYFYIKSDIHPSAGTSFAED